MTNKQWWSVPLLILALVALGLAAKCNSNADIKAGARATAAASRELVKEIDAEVKSGEFDAATAASIEPTVIELADYADKVANDERDFNTLTATEQRQLVEDYLAFTTARADSIEAALHIKNGQSKAQLERIFQYIQRGLSVARVVEAALPPNSTPSPAPTPAQ